jgi:hypothetical protein
VVVDPDAGQLLDRALGARDAADRAGVVELPQPGGDRGAVQAAAGGHLHHRVARDADAEGAAPVDAGHSPQVLSKIIVVGIGRAVGWTGKRCWKGVA